MDDNKFQMEVMTRLTAIETLLKQLDFREINDKLNKAETTAENNKERIEKLEDNGKWLWRTVAGSLILAVLGLIIKLK